MNDNRSGVHSGEDNSPYLPTVGEILSAMTDGEEGGPHYDALWHERDSNTMW